MKHDFHQRKQNRIDHAENQALKNEAESDQLYLRTKEMVSVIPMGQPILVGHHSEKRDRNFRAKIDSTMGRSVAAGKKAEYYAEKAQTIKDNDAIFSDDPEALLKLEQKLATLKGTQDFVKAANRMVRKNDREGFLKLKFAKPEMWVELITPQWWGVGFAPYVLTNNNANIKRIEKRIAGLKALADTVAVHVEINGVRIFENREANRLQLFFNGKPAAEVIMQLKLHGFRWCRSELAWQRHISNNAIYWGKQIAQNVAVQSSL
jgi:predicted peroxiredoxin